MSRVYEALRRAGVEGQRELPSSIASGDGEFAVEPTEIHAAFDSGTLSTEPRSPVASPPVPDPLLHDRPVEELSTSTPPAPKLLTLRREAAQYEGKVLADPNIIPQSREEYRRLAASLHHAQAARGIKVVMVTSAVVGEGKTVTAANLALTLSDSYQKQVLLVDADLRRPSLATVFGIRATAGLTDGLTAAEYQVVPVHPVSSRLCVLPAGRPAADPIAALTSARMRRVIDDARDTFDWVILDTPPVAVLTDANLLSQMTDGAVIVVKAGYTPWDLVERAVEAVGRKSALGVVLNRASGSLQGSGYYDQYYTYSAAGQKR
jgi:capsular exopolysaccharide synthesis family protein